MKKTTLFFLSLSTILLMCTSCASLINKPYKNITIHTTEENSIIYHGDTIKIVENKANIRANRAKEPMVIIVDNDSVSENIEVRSHNSLAYWANLFPLPYGFIVDYNSPKRYTYPNNVYISSYDNNNDVNHWYGPAINKDDVNLHISLPHINSFYFTPYDEAATMVTGFWGLRVGLDYFYSNNQFLNVGVSGVMSFPVPVPAAVDMSGELEAMTSQYISISNNHQIYRFSLGYGLSYGRNVWEFKYYDMFDAPPPSREPVKKSHNAFGLIFPVYYQIGNNFNLGLIYRPTFYRPSLADKFKYEHLISVDFGLKFQLK